MASPFNNPPPIQRRTLTKNICMRCVANLGKIKPPPDENSTQKYRLEYVLNCTGPKENANGKCAYCSTDKSGHYCKPVPYALYEPVNHAVAMREAIDAGEDGADVLDDLKKVCLQLSNHAGQITKDENRALKNSPAKKSEDAWAQMAYAQRYGHAPDPPTPGKYNHFLSLPIPGADSDRAPSPLLAGDDDGPDIFDFDDNPPPTPSRPRTPAPGRRSLRGSLSTRQSLARTRPRPQEEDEEEEDIEVRKEPLPLGSTPTPSEVDAHHHNLALALARKEALEKEAVRIKAAKRARYAPPPPPGPTPPEGLTMFGTRAVRAPIAVEGPAIRRARAEAERLAAEAEVKQASRKAKLASPRVIITPAATPGKLIAPAKKGTAVKLNRTNEGKIEIELSSDSSESFSSTSGSDEANPEVGTKKKTPPVIEDSESE